MTTRTAPLPVPAELDRWRRDTPGCRDRIHLNNAGAALMPQVVLQALTQHLEREAAIGGYEAEDEAEPQVRDELASGLCVGEDSKAAAYRLGLTGRAGEAQD